MPPFFRILFYSLVGLALIALGWEIAARLMEQAFDYLDAPFEYVHSDEIPVPFNHFLEEAMMPSVDKIISSVKEVCYR